MKSRITLRAIRNTEIGRVIGLLSSGSPSNNQSRNILEIAVIFLNNPVAEIRDFGYRILLKYCVRSHNYVPLYDIAALKGFTPIAALLQARSLLPDRENFQSVLMDAYRENFKFGNVYHTEGQSQLFSEFRESMAETITVVAPTSYGKSELIEATVSAEGEKNIAIVVPSKALISQTRQRVLSSLKNKRQVIIHHDMKIDKEKPIIAIVTQERLLRLLQKYAWLSFDILFIDEAHNILNDDKRSRLLASGIIIAKIRNSGCAVKYLTPFLMSTNSLRLFNDTREIKEIKIHEKLKSEDYYVCNLRKDGKIQLYDQYLDKFFPTSSECYNNEFTLLAHNSGRKNIVYLNKPKKIEEFAVKISQTSALVRSSQLEKICREIADYVHPNYRILDCLRRGVVYHHGSVPDVVRAYIEACFKTEFSVKWIVTNSTLLEGVNIPADTLFVLDPTKGNSKLSTAQFRNLAGRVNRFSEIFDKASGSPTLLLPSIYLICGNYSRARANFEDYISQVAKVDRKLEDSPENPLLTMSPATDERARNFEEDLTFIENIEPSAGLRQEPNLARTVAGRLCHVHNIYELDIAKHEIILQDEVQRLASHSTIISDAQQLLDVIADLFIKKLNEDSREYSNLSRLKNPAARSFYSMFFDWRINQVNYGRMIANFIAYWRRIIQNENDTTVYVGRWGDVPRDGYVENYINLAYLSDYDMVNLAIVRIKEEQDFVDNNLVKFVELLNDLSLLDRALYNKVKYGTTDEDQIALIRSGFTHIAASVLVGKYRRHLRISSEGSVTISSAIRESFSRKQERELVTFEVETSGLIIDDEHH